MTTANGFPFSAVVGQDHARAALLLATIDPTIGGVLLRGDKGSAKSTLARGLAALLPDDAPFVELPLGATEDRVLGSLDLQAALHSGEVERFRPGLLSRAHGGVLYVDEVNLLPDHLVDSLLDAAASGVNRVERDGVSHEHAARFVLVGSMNPEEGELRPQLLDRFGLAVEVRTPDDPELRAEAVRRRLAFDAGVALTDGAPWRERDGNLRRRLAGTRPATLSPEVVRFASHTAVEVGAESLRADLVLCRAAAALAGWESRDQATPDDVARVAHLVLSHRRRRRPFEPPTLPGQDLADALDRARQSTASDVDTATELIAPPGDALGADDDRTETRTDAAGWDQVAPDDELDDVVGEPFDPGSYDTTTTGADTGSVDDDTDHDTDLTGDASDASHAGDGNLQPEHPSADDDTQEMLPETLVASRPRGDDPSAGGPPTAPMPSVPTRRWEDLADDALATDPPPVSLPSPASTAGSTPTSPRPQRPSAVRHDDTGSRNEAPARPAADAPRGRVVGDRPVEPDDSSADIAVVPSVRAALRRRAVDPDSDPKAETALQQDDLRAARRVRHLGRTIVFAVDTSGSMGTTERVNAASGAVLGLLADSYVRRDQVALVAFRGTGASEVMPPTGSVELARARLADLETGGTTPLAEGIATALTVAQRVRSQGSEPLLVLLTDGRATGDGEALDRARQAADKVRAAGVDAVVLDAEDDREPLGLAKDLAGLMGGRYLHLSEISAPAVEIAVRNSL